MDILSPSEVDSINRSSELVRKYNQVIDRESAYEILSGKVAELEKDAAGEAARKEWEKRGMGEGERRQPSYSRITVKTPQDQMVKVLTSATFIRGVFGILKKVL
jgi:hypothetical protein